jgi:hypothetical protein
MNRLLSWKLSLGLIAAFAPSLVASCSDRGGGPRGHADASAQPAPSQDKKPEPPKAMIFDKYATPYAVVPAKSDRDDCPAHPQWTPEPTNGQKQASALRPGRAGAPGFCVYKWAGRQGLPKQEDFKKIDGTPEHPVLSITGPTGHAGKPLPKEVFEPLLKLTDKRAAGFGDYRAGVERLKTLEAKAANAAKAATKTESPADAIPPVMLAIIDATPRTLGMKVPDRSGHGFAVSRVAGTLACANPDSPECDKRVVAHLALPIIDEVAGNYDEDWKTGGRTGTMIHLYDALDAAIEEWRKNRKTKPDQRLVINLSIGWDPIKIDENDPSAVRIRTLLERAWCMGALIVAAAGNFTGSSGPIYPAAFESMQAPSADRCDVVTELPPGTTKRPAAAAGKASARYAPLVHSVGAVDVFDMRMLVNRRWGQPRLSALGAAVTVPGPEGMPHTPPMTGTSMSAAIVSGIAAAVWTAEPKRDAAGVMQAIYEGAVELKVGQTMERPQTEYCMDEKYGPCKRWLVRRANLCGALARVQPTVKAACDKSEPRRTDMPHWPPTATPPPTAPKPSEECRLTECGISFGPMENQLPAAVGGHGIANCDFCTFRINPTTGTITLNGTPTSTIPVSSMTYRATLNTNMGQAAQIYPDFDEPMNNLPISGMHPSTTQASITWKIVVGILEISNTTYLAPE